MGQRACILPGGSTGQGANHGTPRGRMNKLHEMFQLGKSGTDQWSSHLYTVDDTDMIERGELTRLQAQVEAGHLNRALFDQEMYCDWTSSLIGAVYGDEITRLTREKRFALSHMTRHFQSLRRGIWALPMRLR